MGRGRVVHQIEPTHRGAISFATRGTYGQIIGTLRPASLFPPRARPMRRIHPACGIIVSRDTTKQTGHLLRLREI